jgi:DMSO/TMAO reductase YedYZ molybdopterin-dependent catalytic subunit
MRRLLALTVAIALLACLPLALTAAYAGEAACALLAGLLFTPALALTRRIEASVDRRAVADAPPDVAWTPSRRALIKGTVASGATVAVAVALGSYELWSTAIAALLGRAETIRTLFHFTPPAARRPGFPVPGEEPEVTPVGQFYLLDKNDVDPLVAPADWSLRLTGAVQRSLSLSYAELLALPRVDEYSTLRCVSNPIDGHLMSTALWSGVSLAAVLRRAGLRGDAATLAFRAPDAYEELIPLDAALHPAALLAYGMNGQSLERKHGGPVRALIPGYFGFKNVKWIESIAVQTTAASGYWAQRGWTADTVHPVSRIDVWRRAAAGLLVAGVAFTGTAGVSASQLRVDDGAWQTCQLNIPALSPLTWVQWRIVLPLPPGKHTLTARVIDAAGHPQDAASADIKPAGAYGLHSVQVNL